MKNKKIKIFILLVIGTITFIGLIVLLSFTIFSKANENDGAEQDSGAISTSTATTTNETATSTNETEVTVENPTPYEITIDSLSCDYLYSILPNDYYQVNASGVMSGPIGTIGVARTMQNGLGGSADYPKQISLDCGGWDFSQEGLNYRCTRGEGDPEQISYRYTETNFYYMNCPNGCVDVNENLYFLNAYVYDPSVVTGVYHYRPSPLVGKELDYTPITCGGRIGYGLRFID